MPKSALKKLPIHKFKAGDPFETCCICLDDFEENDKLRILPCDHGYHSKCIDPWLVKNKRICPQCRKRVFDRGSGYSGESDSDNEQRPLLLGAGTRPGQSTGPSYGGTSGGRPSTSLSVVERLRNSQFVTPSTSRSEPPTSSHFATTSEGARGLLSSNSRLCRGSRRLRRVYEMLDESTSSSDNETEREPQAAIGQAHEGRSNQSPNAVSSRNSFMCCFSAYEKTI